MLFLEPLLFIILASIVGLVVVISLILLYRSSIGQKEKFLWTLLIVFLPFLGPVIYLMKHFIEQTKMKKQRY